MIDSQPTVASELKSENIGSVIDWTKLAVEVGVTEGINKEKLLESAINENSLNTILDESYGNYRNHSNDFNRLKNRWEILKDIPPEIYPEVDWFKQETGKYLVEENVLSEKAVTLGITKHEDESLATLGLRVKRYEVVGDNLSSIEADVDNLVKEIIEKQKKEKLECEENGWEYKRIDDYHLAAEIVYRASMDLEEGHYQVASVFRGTKYETNLPELRVAADLLRDKILGNKEVDLGRLFYKLKASGGEGNAFFSSSNNIEGAEIHYSGAENEGIIKIELPVDGGFGMAIDAGRKGGEYANENEVAILGYIDPDWIVGRGLQNDKKFEKIPECKLPKRMMEEYFLTGVDSEVNMGVEAAEEKYIIKCKRYEDRYGEELGEDFDDGEIRSKISKELRSKYMQADEGINVKLRMKELLESPEGVEINDKYNAEVIKQILTGKHGELVARAIAMYEYEGVGSNRRLFQLFKILNKVVNLQ